MSAGSSSASVPSIDEIVKAISTTQPADLERQRESLTLPPPHLATDAHTALNTPLTDLYTLPQSFRNSRNSTKLPLTRALQVPLLPRPRPRRRVMRLVRVRAGQDRRDMCSRGCSRMGGTRWTCWTLRCTRSGTSGSCACSSSASFAASSSHRQATDLRAWWHDRNARLVSTSRAELPKMVQKVNDWVSACDVEQARLVPEQGESPASPAAVLHLPFRYEKGALDCFVQSADASVARS